MAAEDSFDEFAAHFSGSVPPRTVVTTSPKPSSEMLTFLEMVTLRDEYRKRGAHELKSIVGAAAERGFTNLLVFSEKNKKRHTLWRRAAGGADGAVQGEQRGAARQDPRPRPPDGQSPGADPQQLRDAAGAPAGPDARVPLPVRPAVRRAAASTTSETLSSATTATSSSSGGRAATSARGCRSSARVTLKLKGLQLGTFDTQHGEDEWKHKPELDTSRRRFHV